MPAVAALGGCVLGGKARRAAMKLPVGYVPGQGVVKATAYGGYGQRMLERMGWTKGQGLGKTKDGIKQAIEVTKKEDTLGVGAEQQPGWDWNWKYWEDAYNSAVQKVDHDDSSSSSGSDSDSSDDDAPPRGKAVHNRDGTLATASKAELKLAAELAKDLWGRWGGRGGKMARIREQEAADAAKMRESLGLPPAVVRSAGEASTSSSSSSESDSDSNSSGGRRRKGGKTGKKEGKGKGKAAKAEKKGKGGKGDSKGKEEAAAAEQPAQQEPPKKRIVVVLKLKESKQMFEFKPTPATGWWGAKYFMSAGALESLEDEQRELQEKRLQEGGGEGKAQRRGFDEDDQAALYMQAHEHQRVGRHGLGKGSTLKIAGGKWEGTKMQFEDGDDEKAVSNAAAAAAAVAGQDEAEAAEAGPSGKEGKKGKGKKGKGRAAEKEEEVAEAAEGGKKGKRKIREDAEGEGEAVKQKKSKAREEGDTAVAQAHEGGKKIKKEKKGKKGQEPEAQGNGHAASENGHANGETPSKSDTKRWLKAARKLLKKAPEQKLKAKQLLQQLQEHLANLADGASSAAPSLASLSHLCSTGSELEMQGKYVVLV